MRSFPSRAVRLGTIALTLGTTFLALGPSSAAAQTSTFSFAYSIPVSGPFYTTAVDASGTFTTTATGTPNVFLVTDISGTRNGQAITGLLATGNFGDNDNLLYFGGGSPYLSGNGISYTVDGAGNDGSGNVNVYFSAGNSDYTEDAGAVGYTQNFTVAQLTTTPEPATLALLAPGLIMLGGIARRRARA